MSIRADRVNPTQETQAQEPPSRLNRAIAAFADKAERAMDWLAGGSLAAAAVTLNPGLLAGVPVAMLLDQAIHHVEQRNNPEAENNGVIGNIARTLGFSDDD